MSGTCTTFITVLGLQKLGGAWLGAVRTRIQHKFHNGSDVTWGSNDKLKPEPTVKDIEEIAASAVAAYINQDAKRGDLIRSAMFALNVLDEKNPNDDQTNKRLASELLRLALKEIEEGGL